MSSFTAFVLVNPNFFGDVTRAKQVLELIRLTGPTGFANEVHVEAEHFDDVFAKLNHGSGIELPGYTGRSLSVGDLVVDNESLDVFMCASSGWSLIPHVGDPPKGTVGHSNAQEGQEAVQLYMATLLPSFLDDRMASPSEVSAVLALREQRRSGER